MKKLTTAALASLAAAPAFANSFTPAEPVPEISAFDGFAALAVVAALVLLAWQRRRRAA